MNHVMSNLKQITEINFVLYKLIRAITELELHDSNIIENETIVPIFGIKNKYRYKRQTFFP